MMNQTNGWMVGGVWMWAVLGLLSGACRRDQEDDQKIEQR